MWSQSPRTAAVASVTTATSQLLACGLLLLLSVYNCMCMYIYVYKHTHTYIYIYIYIHIYIYTYTQTDRHTFVQTRMHVTSKPCCYANRSLIARERERERERETERDTGVCEKNTPRRKNTLGKISFQSPNSGAGEQLCRQIA